jgi:hypothetical protein
MDLLPSLTCRLLMTSGDAWRQLTDAEIETHLPSPALHGATLSGMSAVIAALAPLSERVTHALSLPALRSHHDFGSAVRCTIAALSGSMGATALALFVIPAVMPALLNKLRGRQLSQLNHQGPVGLTEPTDSMTLGRAARYASTASLPLAASGWIVALPTLTASYIALALFSALAYRSGLLGARVLLGLSGFDKTLVATLTCVVATLPSLVAAPLHAVR